MQYNKNNISFIAIIISLLVSAFWLVSVVSAQVGGGNSTINTLDQWKSDGTNITQRVDSKPIKITGLTTGLCLTLDGSNVLTTITCGTGGGGGSGGGSWSTTTSTVAGRLINYPNNTSDIVVIGGTATTTGATEVWFDPNTENYKIGTASTASTTIAGSLYIPNISQGWAYLGSGSKILTVSTSTLVSHIFAFPSYGISTSSVAGFLGGLFSTASSTFSSNTFFTALSQGFAYIGSNGKLNTVASSSAQVGLADALSANGANCSAGSFPLGVDASGAAESCTAATISGIGVGNNLGDLTAGDSSLTFSGTYNGSTARNIILNVGNANSWTALQNFLNASSTLLSARQAYFGGTATTTIDTSGNIVIPSGSSLTNTGVSDGCATFASGVLGSTGSACGSGSGTSPYEIATTSDIAVPQVAYFTKTGGRTTLGSVATGTLSVPTGLTITANRSVLGGSATIGLDTGYVIPLQSTLDAKALGATTITINGTTNQITSSAGAQDLSTNRTWTLSFPSLIINPNASTTFFSNIGTAYFGGTATTTIASNGSVTLPVNSLLTFPYSSSTIYSSFITASTTFLRVGLADGCLNITSGLVGSTGSACGSASGLSSYDAWTHPLLGISASTSQFILGTSTASNYGLTIATSTAPQISLSAGGGIRQWTLRNAGGVFYLSTTTVAGNATNTLPAFAIGGASGQAFFSGKLAIGTSTPGNDALGGNRELELAGINTTGLVSISASSSASARVVGIWQTYAKVAGGGGIDGVLLGSQTNHPLIFFSNNSQRGLMDEFGNWAFGTTSTYYTGTFASTTGPQLALSNGGGKSMWTFRNDTGSLFIATTTVAGTATSSVSSLWISPNGTTTVQGLNIAGGASGTTTSSVGFNISNGCYAVNTVCLSAFSNTIGSGGTGSTSFAPNSIITSNSAGTALIATTSNLTVSSLLSTSTLLTNVFLNNNSLFGTSTGHYGYLSTFASSTAPQVSLSAGGGIAQWFMRNAGGDLFFGTTTVAGTATTSTAALTLKASGVPSLTIGTATPMVTLKNGSISLGGGGDALGNTGSTTISMSKIQFDGLNSAGGRVCVMVNNSSALVVVAGACTP